MADKSADPRLVVVEEIEALILTIRGQKVMLDADLASLYGVPTKRLNEQVRRNRDRFPEDFMFRLSNDEAESLRSQFATGSAMRSQSATASKRNVRYQPNAFTEHGAIMAATVLNSPRAVEVSVFVVRTFVKLRQMAVSHKELGAKLDQLEKKVAGHDGAIRQLVDAIRQLMSPNEPPKRRQIGFAGKKEGK